jgi:hypothetical protein
MRMIHSNLNLDYFYWKWHNKCTTINSDQSSESWHELLSDDISTRKKKMKRKISDSIL